MSNLGRNLRAERARKDWNGDEAADRLRKVLGDAYSKDRVYAVERGDVDPRHSEIEAYANIYGVPVATLYAAPSPTSNGRADSQTGSLESVEASQHTGRTASATEMTSPASEADDAG